MQNNRFSSAVRRMSSHTVTILNTLLPILLAEFVWFAIAFFLSAKTDPLKAIDLFHPMIEYLMTSLFLTVGGAAVFDIAISSR